MTPTRRWCTITASADLVGIRSQEIDHKIWATYLFRNMKERLAIISGHKPADKDEIEGRIAETGDVSYTINSNKGGFNLGTALRSFHYQAGFPLSDRSLIAGFLILWFKRCIVPSLPKNAIAINVLYPVVLLACGWPFGLAMVNNVQSGLRALSNNFLLEDRTKGKATKGTTKMKTLNPQVEMPYTYLMVKLVIHCPSL